MRITETSCPTFSDCRSKFRRRITPIRELTQSKYRSSSFVRFHQGYLTSNQKWAVCNTTLYHFQTWKYQWNRTLAVDYGNVESIDSSFLIVQVKRGDSHGDKRPILRAEWIQSVVICFSITGKHSNDRGIIPKWFGERYVLTDWLCVAANIAV